MFHVQPGRDEVDVEEEPLLLQSTSRGGSKRRPTYTQELKEQVIAMLVAGHSARVVASHFKVSVASVHLWWQQHGPAEPRGLAQREAMGQQVYDTVRTTLEALAARARLTADEDWIREQSAAALAHLDAVHWDRVIRLLSALRPAEPPDEAQEEASDLEA